MKYWHLRIHPENQVLEKWIVEFNEKELLEKHSLIGMGLPKESSLLKLFMNEMKLDDIVLIHHHQIAVALVKVIDKVIDRKINDYSKLDWFRYARKVQVLAYAQELSNHFPNSSTITLKQHQQNTPAYEFIEYWYHQIERENDIYHFFKLEEIYINNHPILGNLKLTLKGENGLPLPLVVVSGENGVGKTTLLKYLLKYKADKEGSYLKVTKRSKHNNYISLLMCKEEQDMTETLREYKDSILFIPSGIEDIQKSQKVLIEYYKDLTVEYDSQEESLKSIKDLFSTLFKTLEVGFTIEKIDEDAKIVFLKKESNGAILQMRELSIGEQNLFSKIFILFLNKKRNQNS